VKFAADGAIGLINPMASQLLLPLGPNAALDNLYESLAPLVPDLRGLVDRFTAKAGAVLDEPRLETRVGGARQVLSLTVSRVNDNVYMAVLDDVTKVAEQEQEIFADQQRFRAIFDHVRDYAIYTVSRSGVVEEWNRSLQRVGGWESADVLGLDFAMFFSQADRNASRPAALLKAAREGGSTEAEGWRMKRDGSRFWGDTVITALPDETGAVRGFVVVVRDMTLRKRMEDELRQLSTVDPLTGAFNRRHGHARLAEEFDRRARSGRPLAVMMLDIDWFKRVNDTYGHERGDAVLCALVLTCKATLRTVDMLARWGGEEFVIMLPDTGEEEAMVVAERIRAAIAATPVPADRQGEIAFTVSIGVAVPVTPDVEDVLARADRALYAAKTRGRNRVVLAV
jgi:diguanylate cyclase (GGDEF)-like protein/PAS domain S-box-containing protein